MRTTIRELNFRYQTQLSLVDISRRVNPLLRGWIEYYGRYGPSALSPLLRYINHMLRAWVMRKFKRFASQDPRAFSKGLPGKTQIFSYIGSSV